MIEIYVVSYNGSPPAKALKAVFGSKGGTLGRNPENLLALPDRARHVSRVHASIRFDGTQFLISNVSEANPVFINGEEIESGAAHVLAIGDELRLGSYQLKVRPETVAPLSDGAAAARSGVAARALEALRGFAGTPSGPNPFADLLGPETFSPAPPAEPSRLRPATSMPEPPRIGPSKSPSLSALADPFADLLGRATPSAGSAPASPGAHEPSFAGRIPDDFDPFAMPLNAPRNPDNPLADFAGSSIDLKALDANSQRSGMLDFDLAKKPDAKDPLRGGTPSLVDPLTGGDVLNLFGRDDELLNPTDDHFGNGAPMPDNVPELAAQFTPPRGRREISEVDSESKPFPDVRWTSTPPEVVPPGPDTAATPRSNIGTGAPEMPDVAEMPDAELTTRVPIERTSAAVPAPVVSSPSSPPTFSAPSSPPPPITPREAAVAPAGRSPEADALLAAFLKGAGVPGLAVPNGLTPELMELMGTLVYRAIAGAMELIAARQITKREIRAQVTIIVPKNNNPLKFLPTPEAAIMQLLGPKLPGFKGTAEAMQDAFDDLRAHEVGLIAGVRAALAESLRRFDPAALQQRLGKSGPLDALVPNARKAKLWSLYQELFQEICREAEDDFEALIGKAFVEAYEQQVVHDRAQRGRD